MKSNKYTESSIDILKGLDPIKLRPGMYTYTNNPLHICQEVIDNSVDEALAGYANKILVKLYEDNSITIEDNGRGIPIGIHPIEKISVVELVFTQLHSGSKFNKDSNSAYNFSGGLHGVGISVTNALSKRLEVIIRRDGNIWKIVFSEGEVLEQLIKIGNCDINDTGTIIHLWPNEKYFENIKIPILNLENLLKAKAILLPHLTICFEYYNEEKGEYLFSKWNYLEGIGQYLRELLLQSNTLTPIIFQENYFISDTYNSVKGEGVSVAFTWKTDGLSVKESYVNLIPTPLGGTHENGLKQVLFNVLENFIKIHSMLPKGLKIQSDDVFSNICFILSVKVLDPQFQGQTKEKLISRNTFKMVQEALRDLLEIWINNNVEIGKQISQLVINQAIFRQKSSIKNIEKRKISQIAILPGTLTDCESEDINENEIFLVEGNSAGGSAKLARNKFTQAILPLRGKVLNSFEIYQDHLFNNLEIYNISLALGIEPHSIDDTKFNLNKLRYGKIIILSDADVDGCHIQVLLLTLFYKHFPKLIELGYVYIAQPPLFRLDVFAKSKSEKRYYAINQNDLDNILKKLYKSRIKKEQIFISRFKGLGEMKVEQLKDTAMNPDTRKLLKVIITDTFENETYNTFLKLMGKSESVSRRIWMEETGDLVDLDI